MSDDLIKRLRHKHCCEYVCQCDEAADRIEELVERNKDLALQVMSTAGQAADALDKLAKAVEALQFLIEATTVPEANICITRALTDARAVLAELEGGGERDQKQGG